MGDPPQGSASRRDRGPFRRKDDRVLMRGNPPMDGRALWRSYGIEVDVAWRWVAVLRRHGMPSTTQNAGPPAWPRMDWSVVTWCLKNGLQGKTQTHRWSARGSVPGSQSIGPSTTSPRGYPWTRPCSTKRPTPTTSSR